MKSARATRRSSFGALLVTVSLAFTAAACGDDDDSGASEVDDAAADDAAADDAAADDAAADDAAADGDSDYLAAVEAMIAGGKSGLLYTAVEDRDATVADLQTLEGWQGPESTPAPVENASIAILICVAGTTCEEAAVASAEAAEALGWDVNLIEAQATPESYEEAMRRALQSDVDAILTTAMPDVILAAQLEEAEERGIPTIGMSAIPVENASGQYDAYVPARETLSAMLQAWYSIADSDGTAEGIYLWDTGYPHLQEALEASKRVFAECEGCTLVDETARTTADFANPVEIGNVASTLAQRFGGEQSYMMTAYDLGVPAIVEAIESVGATMNIATKNAHPSSLALIADGRLMMDSGTSAEWVGYAAIDQLIRLMAGEEPIPYWEQGLPVRIFDQENVPADQNFDWLAEVDFKAEYRRLWGVE